MQQTHGHGGGRPQAGSSARHIGEGGDLDAAVHAGDAHCLADEVMPDLGDRLHDLLDRVVDVDVIVESFLDDDVDVLVDRGGKYCAAVDAVVVGKVGATPEEAEAQRRLGDDHGVVAKVAEAWDASTVFSVICGFGRGMAKRRAARRQPKRTSCAR